MKIKLTPKMISLGLSLLGVAGVGATSWLSVKCHEKAKEKTEKKDKILAYTPAIVSGVATSACILGSHHVSAKEIAALTASCAYVTANRDKIVHKVSEKFGHETANDIIKDVEVLDLGTLAHNLPIENTGRGNTVFYDMYSGRAFKSSYADVLRGLKILNNEYVSGTSMCFNDLYDLWGLSLTTMGGRFGWPFWDEEMVWRNTCEGRDDIKPWEREPIRFDIIPVVDDKIGQMYNIVIDEGCWPREDWADY